MIEELRFAFATSHSTSTNGGVFLIKGISYNDFTNSTAVIAATNSNFGKAFYWLADAATVSNTSPCGLAVDGNKKIDFDGLTHSAYTIDTISSRAYYYNLGASNSISNGKMTLTGSNIAVTNAQTITGPLVPFHNGKIVTTEHGSGASEKSLYFLSNTRVYRSDVNDITQVKPRWFKEVKVEIPPGGTNSTIPGTALNNIDYDTVSDRFLILSNGSAGFRSYMTRFPNSGQRFDNIFNFDTNTTDLSTATSSYVSLPYNSASRPMLSKTIDGITHLMKQVAGTQSLTIYGVPISAHWEFTDRTKQVAISPVVYTPNNKSLLKMVINNIQYLGSGPYVTPINDIRSFFRTDGFDDNSGYWYSLGRDGDLSAFSDCKKIQFKFEFQMLGNCWGIPGRLLGFTVIYDDYDTQQNHQPSTFFSTNKSFAWRFSATFSTTLPNLRVRLFDAETNDLLVDDNTSNPKGSFEKTTDGSNWGSWDNLDKTNESTYIRYTPLSLYDGIKIRALLTTLT